MIPINNGNDHRSGDVVFVLLNILCWSALALTLWSNFPR